jgi:hypothetical protein
MMARIGVRRDLAVSFLIMNQRVLTDRRYFAALMPGLRCLMFRHVGSGNNNRQAGLSGNENAQTTVPDWGNNPPRYTNGPSRLL